MSDSIIYLFLPPGPLKYIPIKHPSNFSSHCSENNHLFWPKKQTGLNQTKIQNGDNDKFLFLLYMAILCKFGLHWLASYNPMNASTLYMHIFDQTLHCTVYTVQ